MFLFVGVFFRASCPRGVEGHCRQSGTYGVSATADTASSVFVSLRQFSCLAIMSFSSEELGEQDSTLFPFQFSPVVGRSV